MSRMSNWLCHQASADAEKYKQRYIKVIIYTDAISPCVICKNKLLKQVTHFRNQVVCFYLGYKRKDN